MGVVAALVLLFAFAGCATTAKIVNVAKQCEPSTAQETAIFTALNNPVQAEALAAVDALGFVLCLAQRGVDEIVTSLEPKPGTAALALSAGDYSPVLVNAKAWRAVHP